jgi:pimeloyl-ACP methyl ester carboxylesterase
MRRRAGIGAAVAVFAAAATVGTTPVYAGPPGGLPAPAKAVDWKPCPDQDEQVDCGSLAVPIDWSKPNGPTIDIGLARRKATDTSARIGTLVVLPGGPGGSGADEVKGGMYSQPVPAEVASRFDLVGFDPRGTSGSHPIRCDEPDGLSVDDFVPTTDERFERLHAIMRATDESCRKHTGPLFDFIDTLSAVRDLDAVRAALGEKKLSLTGLSYGTLLGQQYAEKFPRRVRALILDSTMDHSLKSTWDFLRTEAVAVEETFDEFVAWCARATPCALHGRDARRVFNDLYAKAERGELTEVTESGETRKLHPLELVADVQAHLSDPDHTWKPISEILAKLAGGEPADTRARRLGVARFGTESSQDPTAIFCADWQIPVRDAAEVRTLLRRQASVAPDMRLSVQAWGVTVRCLARPAETRNPQKPVRWTGVAPVLLLNSRYDPATPYQWARSVEHQTGAVLLTYDGWGHGVASADSDCATAAIGLYLTEVRTPDRGTHCPAIEPRVS